MSDTYDYTIIGAGSAGCLLANRLSANPKNRVLLLEAGGDDNWIWFHIPVGYLFAINNPRADWCFKTDPIPGLGGRVLNYPRGKVIGGSSAINAMIYMRGQAADYDAWAQAGLIGWSWDDVLPYFLKHQDHAIPPSPSAKRDENKISGKHATGGEWRVEHIRMRWKILDAWAEAAAQSGIPHTDDFNSGDNFGAGYFHVNQRAGRRWSAARGFLKPALSRKKLNLITHAQATRILFDGKRATGVEYTKDGSAHQAHANAEIILSAGAVASPILLERSGIGNAAHLKDLGVEPIHHAPGIGENLQDHLQIRPIFSVSNVPTMNMRYHSLWQRPLMALEYAARQTGPMSMAPSHLGAFARSGPERATPNLQFHVQPLSLDAFGQPLHKFPAITVSVCNLRPTSRGAIHATRNGLSIQPNYLSTTDDEQVAIQSMKLARKIMSAPALAQYTPSERAPSAAAQTDEDLLAAARQLGTTIFHPVGTAKMGRTDDPTAVVDQTLRVIGVDNLRVIDASIMPAITSGNTNSPTLMIAEKGADMILRGR